MAISRRKVLREEVVMVGIHYLHCRRNFYPLLIKILNRVKSPFKFYFHTSRHNPDFSDARFPFEVVQHRSHDYMTKIRWAIDSPHNYLISIDEDVILGSPTWDYLIENKGVLDDDKNLLLSPWLTNGVPTTDWLEDTFVDDETRKRLHEVYLSTEINSQGNSIYPGADPIVQEQYLRLNQHTIGALRWDPEAFYNEVNKITHFWRGINPMRINFEAHEIINQWVLNNLDLVFGRHNFCLMYDDNRPYFCNSVFMIRKDQWKHSIDNYEWAGFDEVAMNEYRRDKKLNNVFVTNSVGIHTLYSNARDCSLLQNPYATGTQQYEEDFYRKIKDYYDKNLA